jgi:hypothetical protein
MECAVNLPMGVIVAEDPDALRRVLRPRPEGESPARLVEVAAALSGLLSAAGVPVTMMVASPRQVAVETETLNGVHVARAALGVAEEVRDWVVGEFHGASLQGNVGGFRLNVECLTFPEGVK